MAVLSELVDFKGGGTPSKAVEEYWGGDIPWASVKDFKSSEINETVDYITDKGLKNSASNLIPKGNLIIPTRMALGKVAINSVDVAINQDLRALIVKDESVVNKRYLFRFMESKARYLESEGKGATVKGITLDVLKPLDVFLPPLNEQKRIAAILDKADSLRRKRQQAIQLADQFLRSVFLDLFGDPVANPKGWEIAKVGSIVDCIVPGRDKPKSFTGNIPWITTNDLCHLGLTKEAKDFIGLTELEIKEVKAQLIPKGSVLMTCVGDLGIVSISSKDIVINQQLHAFLPSQKINNIFLMYALSFQKPFMLKMASNTTVPYMNKTICNSIPVIIPSIEIQNQFGKIYEKVKTQLISVEQTKVNCEKLFNSCSQKAFAGEL